MFLSQDDDSAYYISVQGQIMGHRVCVGGLLPVEDSTWQEQQQWERRVQRSRTGSFTALALWEQLESSGRRRRRGSGGPAASPYDPLIPVQVELSKAERARNL